MDTETNVRYQSEEMKNDRMNMMYKFSLEYTAYHAEQSQWPHETNSAAQFTIYKFCQFISSLTCGFS